MDFQPPDNSSGDSGNSLFDGSGPFIGGSAGGPPPGDAIFASFDVDDESSEKNETEAEKGSALSLGLHFFGEMNNLEP